ncbi:MAG: MerR family transcriptional regulator, partial [Stigonema ocellatum SAG 48.90 = DSM 106950]|nr:MerR family transcriptional regulator [Stigonema ocellatum SAG 48.90 = DSM 106950]
MEKVQDVRLQYWREKGVIVPVISETGTGRSIYYSKANLVELAVM